MTIALSPETEALLNREAARRGIDVAEYVRHLVETALPQSKADALSRWEALNETDDPEEIARRQKEFEEFKEAMNRNRLETEGLGARKVFP